MTAEAFRCADSAEARQEPLYGTASFVRRWLLLEQPGSWGRHALTQSGLPEPAAGELRRRARAASVRIVLIRRGVRLSSERRQCYFVRTEEGNVYQSHLEIDGIDELLDTDLSALATGGSIEGTADRRAPVFLVCTHGKHDACCSIRGNQVSRVACAETGADAWECSHIGGDRFAANLVCFPHGVYYGRVRPADVVALMHAYTNGILSLDHYRGRCSHPFAVQAAEYFVRRESATTAIDAVRFLRAARTERGLRATFSLAGDRVAEAEVAVGSFGDYRLTCRAALTHPIPRYDLVACTVRHM